MKQIRRQSTTFVSTVVIAVVVLILAFIFGFNRVQATDGERQSGRLVTIHDRNQEKVLLTEAETIADALQAADISLDARDTVEPALDEKLVASEYQVNIYRARPVVIVDGAVRQKVVTPYQTADQILKDTGINLFPEDRSILSRSDDIVSDGAGLELTVDRAIAVNLTLYGTKTTVRTQGDTIGAMLREKNIELEHADRTSLPLSTPITAGMEINVWREGKQTITVEESVPFPVEQIRDADREVGYKHIQTAGKEGTRNATYEIEIKEGVEISRTEIASLVTAEPSKQVEIIGVKRATLPYTGGGTKTEWLAASNIPPESWGYADYMVQKESSWNPNAINRSSGACGLAQALPCSKVPGNPFDPVNSLNWMNSYVNGRYGGWEGAYNFWLSRKWY